MMGGRDPGMGGNAELRSNGRSTGNPMITALSDHFQQVFIFFYRCGIKPLEIGNQRVKFEALPDATSFPFKGPKMAPVDFATQESDSSLLKRSSFVVVHMRIPG